ncbi:MAG: hypothetical protein K0R50_3416 [Eubacterium sp.]|nr:hypothetical protein [Eubacterium sp.]
MKRNLRVISLAVAATLMLGTLAGCGGKNGLDNSEQTASSASSAVSESSTSAGALDEKVEISVGIWDISPDLTKQKDQFYEKMCKDLNITINPKPLTWDDYTQKIQLWASSGELPDVFAIDAVGTSYYRNWIKQGVVRAIPEDLSKYPVLQKYMENADFQAMKDDGKLYCVPRAMYDSLDYCAHDRNVFYRWDLAQKAGITKEPETWEEFKTMLAAINEKDPENKNIGGLTAVNVKQIGGFFWLFSNPAATSDGSGSDFKWINEDGKYIPAVFSKNALPSLQNARDMYEKGLVDKDIALVKGQQGYDKFVQGKASAVLCVTYNGLNTIIKNWKKAHPEDTDILGKIKRIKYFPSTDGTAYHSTFKTYWSESYFSSKVDDKKMDRIMRLYDYLLSDDTKEYIRFGVKDVDYTKDEAGNITTITTPDELSVKQPSAVIFADLANYNNQFMYSPNNKMWEKGVQEAAAADLEYSKKASKTPEFDAKLTYLSTPTKDKFSILDHEDILKIMLGKQDAAKMWEDTLKEYEAKGLTRMIEEVNEKAK